MADYFDLSLAALQSVRYLTETAPQVNINQCRYLCEQLSEVVRYAKSIIDSSGRWEKSLKELCRVAKDVEILVHDCCNEQWLHAAIMLADADEAFALCVEVVGWCKNLLTIMQTFVQGEDHLDGIQEVLPDLSQTKWRDTDNLKAKSLRDRMMLIGNLEHLKESSSISREESHLVRYLLQEYQKGTKVESYKVAPFESLDLSVGRCLARGRSGTVYETEWLGQTYAMKIFKGLDNESFKQEADRLVRLRHPHIVGMIRGPVDERSCSIVMELMPSDLRTLVEQNMEAPTSNFPFAVSTAIDIMLQIASGMEYLHRCKVAHRDLKPSNILIRPVGIPELGACRDVLVKVCDFGLTETKTASNLTSSTGTSRWSAPELCYSREDTLNTTVDSYKADVYSYAMIFFEIVSGFIPFPDVRASEVRKRVLSGIRPEVPATCPSSLVDLIHDCWDSEPIRRPTFANICERLRHLKLTLLIGDELQSRTNFEVHDGLFCIGQHGEDVRIATGFLRPGTEERDAKGSRAASSGLGSSTGWSPGVYTVSKKNSILPVHEVWPPEGVQCESNLNIIFFRGLQFHDDKQPWRRTWGLRDDPQVCWPETWLPEDLGKNIRVLLVDYDSAISRTNTEDVSDIGHNLNESLVNSDKWSSGWNQPTVLVGHSFGGLVIKSLMVEVGREASRDPHAGSRLDQQFVARARAFLGSIRGISFYGTPRFGSNITNLLDMGKEIFFKVLSDVGIMKNITLSRSMEMLSTSFEDLVQIQEINVFAFTEGRPSRWGTYVVPHASASQYSHYNQCKVEDADHEEICRPPDKNHQSYQLLLQMLRLSRTMPRLSDNLHVADFPVGLSERANEVIALMQTGASTVGIYGMGGCGKTTIAKEVFNRMHLQFDASSFLTNEREMENESGRLSRLQRQLLQDLAYGHKVNVNNSDHGIELLKERLFKLVVLIVIDDADDYHCHLIQEALVAGSCLIVISRAKQTLLNIGVDPRFVFEVGLLTSEEAKRLFDLHAFGQISPDDDFQNLANEIVASCGGHPLTLIVIGRLLERNRERKIWVDVLSKLRSFRSNLPEHFNLFSQLQISYDALEPSVKEMFLDVACSLDLKKDMALDIWRATGWSATIGLETLMYKNLVKVDEYGYLIMHDQLRYMGKYIVKKNCETEPGRWSRLAMPESEFVMLQNEVRLPVQCLSLRGSDKDVTTVVFTRMERLRFLILDGCGGSLSTALPKGLKYLSWMRGRMETIPEPILEHENIGVLDLSHSQLACLWRADATVKLRNLQVLYLSNCLNLKEVPGSIVYMRQLRRLDLSYCEHLESIPVKIGQLKELVDLNLRFCKKLLTLPSSIGDLPKLQVLDLFECESLTKLPDSICNLTRLQMLDLWGLEGVHKLPTSFRKLVQLRMLNLGGCSHLEEDRNLVQLQTLKSGGCSQSEEDDL